MLPAITGYHSRPPNNASNVYNARLAKYPATKQKMIL